MKKIHLMKRLTTAVVAASLIVSSSVGAFAGTTSQTDTSQVEATTASEATASLALATFGAPTASIKEQTASGQITTSWKFQYTAPTYAQADGTVSGPTVYMIVYNKGDRTEADYGSVYKDKFGQYIPSGYSVGSYQDPTKNPTYKYEETLYAGNLTPGAKEVVFYVYDSSAWEAANDAAYDAAWAAYAAGGYVGESPDYQQVSKAGYYYYSSPISITVSMESGVSTTVTTSSITLSMSDSSATGYEIRKKIGSKYKLIDKVASSTYTDKGLASGTTYTYKIRPYYVDSKTGKKTYGMYTYAEATTKGSALKLKASLGKKNKVSLSWTKVKGATKYEVYRSDTYSSSSNVSKGESNSFASYKLVATVKKNKKKYVDKKTLSNMSYSYIVKAVVKDATGKKTYQVSDSVYVSTSFGSIDVTASYTDAKGNKTLKWRKVSGATGYLVEKSVPTYVFYNSTTGSYRTSSVYNIQNGESLDNTDYNWVQVKKLSSSATSYKFAASGINNPDGSLMTDELEYRIRAINKKGAYSSATTVETHKTAGVVSKVTAKKTTNGIKVSWTKVAGASYYEVYRVKAGTLVKNSDLGGYPNRYSEQVTEYVGVTTPKAVDVASWNAQCDAGQKAYEAATGDVKYSSYLHDEQKLDTHYSYYYQNYSYSRNVFDANTTSIVDYSGDIYRGYGYRNVDSYTAVNQVAVPTDSDNDGIAVDYYYDPVVKADDVETVGPQAGVAYQYYVVAYFATANTTVAEYMANESTTTVNGTECIYDPAYMTTKAAYNTAVTGPQLSRYDNYSTAYAKAVTYVNTNYSYRGEVISTVAVKSVGKATYTATKAPTKKATIKSVKAKKTTVTLKIKKKVKNAKGYKIYRSTKKKSGYVCVGTTTKLTFKDTGLKKGKKYYYKVVPYSTNEASAMVTGKTSKVKSVTVK